MHRGLPITSSKLRREKRLVVAPTTGVPNERHDTLRYPIPATLNIALVAIQVTLALTVLRAASQTTSATRLGLLAVVFALVMQLGFCLAHEAVHSKLHPNHNVNEAL